uniref:Glyoxylate reductase/hydroxypyruvate reductase n=1 Tax=Geotrypetes seraphini TaxID=260995 RepID=A0A6P8Q565_GEOSA|nr:glyoxylate/hydroxypyruvate reductase B-like [Geotrypetes seraphini]XP_033790350.1 glyoxylate/hydroxypyruvate reductase B-like [Geotrypetes seraphini]XP_033790351.1 glyoxylate/hydroxypyruvate reductase B-like [Geotrypetes seraphini]XP_033790352.1 glyoxylate/hydroxypyruvate reductase B-like [Geotrypetes seraphini]XP_033790353.1 glyoxylate/hydroxypyruvate reductase B-like [Geotrypetes seraphini]XP_033790354.1 glyoxylate/hydroxypyruvate reductase B-like [Geotrypetes seraphini]
MDELPVVLVQRIGDSSGIVENHLPFLKKHFTLVTMQEFTENQQHFSEKIRAVFIWLYEPVIDQKLLQSLPNLKVIASAGAGVDHLALDMISSFGVKVTNTPLAVSNSTADLAMVLLLASAKNLQEAIRIAASPDTQLIFTNWMADDVTGATLGIIGMGRIGLKIAQRAKAFEMKILYHNRNQRKEEEERAVGATYCAKMDDLLQQSDFVILVVNLTPETYKLIGKRELQLMKPTATLINVSRGAVMDQDALVEALQKGVIKAAALDVTYPEPLPRAHPLLRMKNVIVTPHIGSATHNTRRLMMQNMTENILAVLNGHRIANEVTSK